MNVIHEGKLFVLITSTCIKIKLIKNKRQKFSDHQSIMGISHKLKSATT